MRRIILAAVLIPIALLAIAAGVGYWIYYNHTFYSTDDAQISGQIINISAPASGKLATLSVKQGDTVTAGESIGTITVLSAASSTTGTGATGRTTAQESTIALTSPISGTIVMAPAVSGQLVAAGLTVAQVTDLKAVNVTAYIDENSIDSIKTGQTVDITVDAFKGTSFSGHIQRIVQATAGQFSLIPNQDNTSSNFTKVGQRIPVIITLDGNGGKDLLPGMSASVSVHIN